MQPAMPPHSPVGSLWCLQTCLSLVSLEANLLASSAIVQADLHSHGVHGQVGRVF